MPNMEAPYKYTRYRPRRQDNHVSFEHFYRVDIFLCILAKQLHELNTRFNDEATGLLTLSSALVPKKGIKRLILVRFVILLRNIILKISVNKRYIG